MSEDIEKILELGPKAAAKAYQDILKKIKEGTILTPAEVKSLDLLEKKLQESTRAHEENTIVDSLEKVAKHFKRSVRQIQRWIKQEMPVLSGGRYDLKQIEAWRRLKGGGRGPAAADDPSRHGQLPLTAENGKDFWDMRGKMFQAQQRELDLRVRRGELVERKEVEQLFIARIMAVKQGLLSFSRGLPPQLIHCKDEREMEIIVAREVRDLLEKFSRSLPDSLGGSRMKVAEGDGFPTV